jgi:hypothetical protein
MAIKGLEKTRQLHIESRSQPDGKNVGSVIASQDTQAKDDQPRGLGSPGLRTFRPGDADELLARGWWQDWQAIAPIEQYSLET